jgi:hypothetical protein
MLSRSAQRFAALSLAAVSTATSCSALDIATNAFVTDDFSGDPYPIAVNLDSGAVLVGVKDAGTPDQPIHTAVIDILAPITVQEQSADDQVRIRSTVLTILGRNQITGALDIPRAQLRGSITDVHACPDSGCQVGSSAAPTSVATILGADNFGGDAIRLRLANQQIYVLPTVGPSDSNERGKLCDAVFPSPFRGGGTLRLGNTEVAFVGRRVTITACAASDPRKEIAQGQRGTDLLLVASTGIGPTMLSESTYIRYQRAHSSAVPLAQLPTTSYWLPSGQIAGRMGTISNLTLAAPSSEGRGACREAYAHHLMYTTGCDDTVTDCPCSDATNCGAPALVELAPPAGLTVFIVADSEPILQGLRAELRPDQAEADGLLGTDAMRAMEIDIDYPNGRVLARCVDATCKTRPTLASANAKADIAACIKP